MSENAYEKLSAFMDGELDHGHDSILDAMEQDDNIRRKWWRYHLITDVLNQDTGNCTTGIALAERISAGIRNEPHILSRKHHETTTRYLKPLAGMAIAASVAAVAILGIQQHTPEQTGGQVSRVERTAVEPANNLAPRAPAASVTQQIIPAAGQTQTPPAENIRLTNAANARMNSYLLNYNEYRTMGNSMQGMIPYVRIIANDSEQQ